MAAARVVSTKKFQPNQKQFLLNAGLAVIEADFIGVNYKPFTIQHTNSNLIFTSKNAFKSFLRNDNAVKFKGSTIFCVGSKTKEVIENNGYRVLAYADTAEALSEIIVRSHVAESFTFFCGSMRRDTLPDALTAANIEFVEVEVYETVLTPHTIKAKADGLLFYSPSGIESYLSANAITTETCFCIGATTAASLAGITANVVIANKPSVENVIIQCINYYKN
jgi:uroporphyrinogen-III synthase